MPGEVEYFSILDNKKATKTYWESRMVSKMDEGGWESVANVRFQPFSGSGGGDGNAAQPRDTRGARIVETVAKKPAASQENIIEAEIRAQQRRETEMRRQQTEGREKGASSPASHDSDEGFVDRLEVTAGPTPPSPPTGYTHALPGTDGEPVIYDAVSPPPPSDYLSDRSTPTPSNPPVTTPIGPPPPPANATEARIALEIRELKEREDELRQMREELMASRDNLLEDEDEEEVRSSASREQLLEDHLTSLTTTTDEGNYSECGDPASSSEDKSSDGSNSRMMSPDLHQTASHLDFARRRVTVKPYEEEEEDQPVYTRMQKESVIEREIRLAREREEAYRREKGLLNGAPSTNTARTVPAPAPAPSTFSSGQAAAPLAQIAPHTDGRRDVQHRMATSRIQLEIQETSQKEKELRDAGKILTTSEETVDSKVTRLSDFSCDLDSPRSPQPQPQPPQTNGLPRHSTSTTPSSTPKRCLSPRTPVASPTPVPNFTPSPAAPPPPPAASSRLSRSLSTNNLSTSSTSRPTKGLMQKFIASRGKMTGSAFISPPPTLTHITSRGVPTRPMRVEPKSAVIQRESMSKIKVESALTNGTTTDLHSTQPQQQQKQYYRRSYCTAEEKIQSELKEMQMREEELRRLRAFQMARSQPNLLDIGGQMDASDLTEAEEEEGTNSLTEVNGFLRPAQSNPNLMDEPEQNQVPDKTVRRRSALIAQWENRIQQTTDT